MLVEIMFHELSYALFDIKPLWFDIISRL